MQQFTNSIAPAVLTQYLYRPTAWRSTDKTNRPKEPASQPTDLPNLTRQFYSPTHQPITRKFILISSSCLPLNVPSGLFTAIFPPSPYMYPSCHPSVHHAPAISFILIISPEKYLKIEKYSMRTTMMISSLYYFLQSPVTFSLFDSSVFNTLWSNAFSLFFPQCDSPCFTSTQTKQTY
jgi:hypothetical protein